MYIQIWYVVYMVCSIWYMLMCTFLLPRKAITNGKGS